jgi:hypothetical protein
MSLPGASTTAILVFGKKAQEIRIMERAASGCGRNRHGFRIDQASIFAHPTTMRLFAGGESVEIGVLGIYSS